MNQLADLRPPIGRQATRGRGALQRPKFEALQGPARLVQSTNHRERDRDRMRRKAIAAVGETVAFVGIAALEEKSGQRGDRRGANANYEAGYLGYSYGCRPGRGPNDALGALVVGIERKKVTWLLDADPRNFFTSLGHSSLV